MSHFVLALCSKAENSPPTVSMKDPEDERSCVSDYQPAAVQMKLLWSMWKHLAWRLAPLCSVKRATCRGLFWVALNCNERQLFSFEDDALGDTWSSHINTAAHVRGGSPRVKKKPNIYRKLEDHMDQLRGGKTYIHLKNGIMLFTSDS